jgi:hypothetical protein
VQGNKTRWGSHSKECEKLLRHRAALRSAVQDPQHSRIAIGRTRQMDVEEDENTPYIDTESAPYALQRHSKYTATYLTVQDEGFWVEAEIYVNMNKNVCAAIGVLSSDSALLWDTAISMLKL